VGEMQPAQDELRRRLAILERTLAELAGTGATEADLAPFRRQAEAVRQQLIGAGVQAGRDLDVGGDVVLRDKIGRQINTAGGPYVAGDFIITADSPPEDLLCAYYRCVAAECSRLPLGVIDTEFLRASQGGGQGEQAIPLPDIYVDLDVVAPAQERGKNPRAWALQLARGEGKERTALLDALSQPAARRAVLLGDAGTGKTTFVNYLAYLLAADPDRLPAPFRGLLLVRLVLREVAARHLPPQATEGTAAMLWNALADDVASHLGKPLADKLLPYLQTRLLAEGGFILLDGLDEVPEARQRREVLIEAVAKLTQVLPKNKTRVLVTARPYAYADPRWQLAGFAELALAPFNEGQVDRFIERWYQAVRSALGWNPATAAGKGAELRAALRERAYLGDLASRPLLLTLMATLHSSWGKLPEDRADLYEETVKLLLSRWQRAREVRRPDGELEVEPSIAQALGMGEARLRAALESLAYAVHQRQRAQPEREDAPADITEADLLVAFKPLLGEVAPDTLLGYLRDRAGLLVAREEGVYAFPHRTFQEYLAACHLADRPDFAVELKALACADPAWWREVCLLGIGKARRGGVGQAAGVVNVLLPAEPEDVADRCTAHWQLAVLAGLALTELRLREQAQGRDHYAALLRRARRWLVQLVEGGHLSARERAEAGDVLGQLGDPRFDPDFFHLPCRYRGQPEPRHGFIEIPPGPFVMGSQKGDEDAWEDEFGNPAQLNIPYRYWIARYPVTVAQYAAFLAAGGGAEDAPWWTETGRAWRRGEWDSQVTEDWLKDWLKQRPRAERAVPMWWHYQESYPNRPVMGVSWFEAAAYCRWLDAQLRAYVPGTSEVPGTWVIPSGYCVRLPTEAEWEKAARAGDARRFPWGDAAWDENRANIERKVGHASAVCSFPAGATPGGIHDLSGNVWEWTASLYRPYPYRADDGRNAPEAEGPRVVRGGSWNFSRRLARCAVRSGLAPDYFFLTRLGFRVVVSLSASGF